MDKKIVFFDIDGTLYNEEKELPERTKEAVIQLKERGHEVVIATGRAPFIFADLREELEIDSYISLNGQYVVHQNKPIYTNPFNNVSLNRLSEHAINQGHHILYVNEKGWRMTGEKTPLTEEVIGTLKVNQPIEYNSGPFEGETNLQSLIFCSEEEEIAYREQFPEFEFIRWHENSMDILPKGSSKARGIQEYLQATNGDLEHTYAFGDGLNDIEMMELIPNSVAMGNAFDEVKAASKHVTDHVSEDGIWNALKKLGLIK